MVLTKEELNLSDVFGHFGPRANFGNPVAPGDQIHVHLKCGLVLVCEVLMRSEPMVAARVKKITPRGRTLSHGWNVGDKFSIADENLRLVSRASL